MAIIWGGGVFGIFVSAYGQLGIQIINVVPLLLMIWSSIYIVPWLYRIFEIIKRQYTTNIIDTLGVIPKGQTFITLAVCHAVINRSDQLQWFRIIRLMIMFVVCSSLLIATAIVLFQFVSSSEIIAIVPILIDIGLLILMIWLEHQQSVLLAYYLSLFITDKLVSAGEMITVAMVVFVLVQFMSGVMPFLGIIVLRGMGFEVASWSFTLLVFIIIHELILVMLVASDDRLDDI